MARAHKSLVPPRATPDTPWLRRYAPVLLLIVAGTLISYAAFAFVQTRQQGALEDAFVKAAQHRSAVIQRSFARSIAALESVGALFASSRRLDRQQFRAFAQPMLARYPGLHSIGWIPQVTASRRAYFETEARKDFPHFQITERSDLGELRRASNRDLYYPVFYLEPYSGNELVLGFDFASSTSQLAALIRSRDTGQISATGKISLVKAETATTGMLLFLPMYRQASGQSSIEQRRDDLAGFATTILRIHDVVDFALDYLQPDAADVILFDAATAEDGGGLLYASRSIPDIARTSRAHIDEWLRERPLIHETEFQLAGRRFLTIQTPRATVYNAAPSLQAIGVLLGGLIFTGLLAAYVQLVRTRASEFGATTLALQKEVAERKRAQKKLLRARDFYLALFDRFPTLIWRSGADGKRNYFNEAWLEFTGRPLEREIGSGWIRGVHPQDVDHVTSRYLNAFVKKSPFQIEYRLQHQNGKYRWVVDIGRPFDDWKGRFGGYIGTCVDIHDRRLSQARLHQVNVQLERLSREDALTRIANRRRFDEYIGQEWDRAARRHAPLSLIIADIDYFKAYNDRYGHIAGDKTLREMARSFQLVVDRPADLVARYGGEELAVVLPETGAKGARSLAEKIHGAVRALAIPHEASPVTTYVTVSLGVGTITPTPDTSLSAFIEIVDRALYQAKQEGRNRTVTASLSSRISSE